MMEKAWLSLGANIGEPAKQLEDAVERLARIDGIAVTKRSSIIRTRPWGKTDQPDFANMAIEIATDLDSKSLLDACLAVEKTMGRERMEVWGPRLIDIDIIAFGRQHISSDSLTIPHPHAFERDFVLIPLTEIDPDTARWVVDQARIGAKSQP